jgi:hypothetical protein
MAADKKIYVIGFIVLAVIVMIVVLVATSLKKLASDESKYCQLRLRICFVENAFLCRFISI